MYANFNSLKREPVPHQQIYTYVQGTYHYNNIRLGVECPGNGHPLPLPPRQVDAPLSDVRHIFSWQDVNVRLQGRRSNHTCVAMAVIWSAEQNVVPQTAVQQPRFLRDIRNTATSASLTFQIYQTLCPHSVELFLLIFNITKQFNFLLINAPAKIYISMTKELVQRPLYLNIQLILSSGYKMLDFGFWSRQGLGSSIPIYLKHSVIIDHTDGLNNHRINAFKR